MRNSLTVTLLAVIGAGCSGTPPLVPVTAVVTIDGQPTENVTVCFFWAEPSADLSKAGYGRGVSGPEGKVVVRDMYGRDGMFPGKYKVTFEQFVTRDGKPIDQNSKPTEIYGGAHNKLPKRYHSPDTTDVIVEVPRSGLQTTLAISSK
jgi:hypothetical protein